MVCVGRRAGAAVLGLEVGGEHLEGYGVEETHPESLDTMGPWDYSVVVNQPAPARALTQCRDLYTPGP